MLDLDPAFRPVTRPDGHHHLEDLGVVGDGQTVALVGLDGCIPWLCLPRFDADPVFCGLLDDAHGGHFTMTPEDLREARQCYVPDSGVLVTQLRTPTGTVQVTDALALREGADLTDDAPAGRSELVRSAEVIEGTVRLRVEVEPRDGAQAPPHHVHIGRFARTRRGRGLDTGRVPRLRSGPLGQRRRRPAPARRLR